MVYLLAILPALFWSGNFVLSRGMHAEIPPLALSYWRWVLALFILLFFAMKHLRSQKELLFQNSRYLIIQGLLGVTGFNTLVYLAIQHTTAINAVLVNSCIPVIIVFSSWLMYNERLKLVQCLGVCISLSGVLLIISDGNLADLLKLQFNRGDILVFFAAICWALYSANLKRYPQGLHPLAYQIGIMITGLIALTPLYAFELLSGKTFAITITTVGTILYVSIFASVLAFIFWNRAVTVLGANTAGPFIHLMPVFSTILAVSFLGETLTPNHVKAILLIFGGILLTTIKRKEKTK